MRLPGILSLLAALLLAACGSPNFGSMQTIRVDTQPPAVATCTVANAEMEASQSSPPGVSAAFLFDVPKSPSPLTVSCLSTDGRSGSGVVPAEELEPFTGSPTLASVFGTDVDENTGKTYRYPASVRVLLSAPTRFIERETASRLALSPMLASRITGVPVAPRSSPGAVTPPPTPEQPVETVRLQTMDGEDTLPPFMTPEEPGEIMAATNAAPDGPPSPGPVLDAPLNDAAEIPDGPTALLPGETDALPQGGLVQPISPAAESELRAASARDAAGLPPLAPLQPAEPVEMPPIAAPVEMPTTDVLPRCAFGQVVVPAEADTCLRSGGRLLD